MDITRICCVTGHRDLSGKDVGVIQRKLRAQILLAIRDGYTTFLSGFAEGVDLLFAQTVIELKGEHPVFLEAALPYANRAKGKKLQPLLARCDKITAVRESYAPDCFQLRNRYLVDRSARVIAVYDGREKGGALFTMGYARKMKRDLRVIHI